MRKWLFTICFLPFISAFGQNERNAALLVSVSEGKSGFTDNIVRKIINQANGINSTRFYVYDWNATNESLQFVRTKHTEENAVSMVHFFDIQAANTNDNPELVVLVDTSGKTRKVLFPVRPAMRLQLKSIELKSSEVLKVYVESFAASRDNFDSGIYRSDIIIDFLKEFGTTDPAKLKRDNLTEYREVENRIREKYRKKVIESFQFVAQDWGSRVASSLYELEKVANKKWYNLVKEDDITDEKKIKTIKSTASLKDSIKIGEAMGLYEVVKFGGFITTRYVNHFYAKAVNEAGSELDLQGLASKKNLAETLKEGKDNDFILAPNMLSLKEFNRQINGLKEPQNVAIKTQCMFCQTSLERNLMTVPSVKLIERSAGALKYFRNLAKSEKFMDLVDGDDQFKQLGVKYLFYKEDNTLKSTDIETGRVIGSSTSQGKFLGLKLNNAESPMVIKTLFADTFNKPIQVLSYSEETKNKVKEVIITNEFGLLHGEVFNIYSEESEDVNGKEVKRYQKIGEGIARRPISELVAPMKVTDGEKDFFEAKSKGKNIVIQYRLSKD